MRAVISSHIGALLLVVMADSRNSNRPATAGATPRHESLQLLIWSRYRTSDVLELHFSGNGVNQSGLSVNPKRPWE